MLLLYCTFLNYATLLNGRLWNLGSITSKDFPRHLVTMSFSKRSNGILTSKGLVVHGEVKLNDKIERRFLSLIFTCLCIIKWNGREISPISGWTEMCPFILTNVVLSTYFRTDTRDWSHYTGFTLFITNESLKYKVH